MKNKNKYKVLVLSDLTDDSVQVLRSASRIAKEIDGEIEVFHVRKPTKVVEKTSHLSAVRSLKDNFVLVEKKLEDMCALVSEDTQMKVNPFFSFGNLKNEITDYIEKSKPDIVVLGKRTSKTPVFLGDNIFTFILKNFQGVVMVANNENVLEAKTELCLGLFNSTTFNSTIPLMNTIISNTGKPIRSFGVTSKDKEPVIENETKNESLVSYVFEKNDQTLKTMSNYMDINKVNLLLVDRKSASNSSDSLSISELNELAYTIKIPLLLSNN